MCSKFLKTAEARTHTGLRLHVCLKLCPSGELTSGASPTHSPGWTWSRPPATTSSSASRSVAARTFCRSCCCSSFVGERQVFLFHASKLGDHLQSGTLLSSPPWPDPTFSCAHLVWLPPHSGPAEKLLNNRAPLRQCRAQPRSHSTRS